MGKIRYRKIPGKVAASAALIALLGLPAAQLVVERVSEYEGYVPEAYQDPVGIWTKCFGETENVVPGAKYTFEECVKGLNEHVVEIGEPVMRCVPGLREKNYKVRAAMVSMAYNIGNGAFCRSSITRMANEGDWEGACRRMGEIYKTARGKELPGLVRRRAEESRLCLDGLEEERRGILGE